MKEDIGHRRKKNLLKNVVFAMIPTVLMILVLEVVLRVGAFFWFDHSKYYLFYGFHGAIGKVGISPWWTKSGKYFKFPPNYVLHGAAGQADEEASTNSLGFRGPDFLPQKPEDVFRIICLGGSSTFGFHNSDEGTYPFLLQKLFEEEERRQPSVDVINAGFPYYNTGSILSILKEELLRYEPDLMTLYTGYNDIDWPLKTTTLFNVTVWLQDHSIVYLALKQIMNSDYWYYKIRIKLERMLPAESTKEELESQADKIAGRYRKNLEEIVDIAHRHDIALIFIMQPMRNTFVWPRVTYDSYDDEFQSASDELTRKGSLPPLRMKIITHHRLMEELVSVAEEHGILVVDNVAIVDRDRRRLASHVHLTEEGNLRLAEALKRSVEPLLEDGRGGPRQTLD